jgi:hypothetical protein
MVVSVLGFLMLLFVAYKEHIFRVNIVVGTRLITCSNIDAEEASLNSM